MMGRSAFVRLSGMLVFGLALAVAGCSGAKTQASAPAKRVVPPETSVSASISASDEAMLRTLRALAGTLPPSAAERGRVLAAELEGVPLVSGAAISLPGTAVAHAPKSPAKTPGEAASRFIDAVAARSSRRYLAVTGRRATGAQLDPLRERLAPPIADDGMLIGRPPARIWSSPGSVMQRAILGVSDLFWVRTELTADGWRVAAMGGDQTFAGPRYAKKLEFVFLVVQGLDD
jgi:hypothetical protein